MKRHDSSYEIRCPVHGFIPVNDLEMEIISAPAFQRLRRVRQLAWTDQVYPGAMHSRFEHSLGVMHTATLLYKAIWARSSSVLKEELAYTDGGLERDLQLVRLAALLHDVGHSPFSHAAEELFPEKANGTRYKHEDYSAAIVRKHFKDVIQNHPFNSTNHEFTADDVAALLDKSTRAKHRLFWRDLIDGQMDADRMDYLLRDSYHAGVAYGKFDLNRIVNTIVAIPGARERAPRLGFSYGGLHAAESLVLARYFMFTQVYFHKTRVAFDIHLKGALKDMLPGGTFPAPTEEQLDGYLKWDDWRVCGLLADGAGGEHGKRLRNRDHYRLAYASPEVPSPGNRASLDKIRNLLGDLVVGEEEASKSWYKTGALDIAIVGDLDPSEVRPLSVYSTVLANMKAIGQVFLYVRPEDSEKANSIVRKEAEDERTRQASFGFDNAAR